MRGEKRRQREEGRREGDIPFSEIVYIFLNNIDYNMEHGDLKVNDKEIRNS